MVQRWILWRARGREKCLRRLEKKGRNLGICLSRKKEKKIAGAHLRLCLQHSLCSHRDELQLREQLLELPRTFLKTRVFECNNRPAQSLHLNQSPATHILTSHVWFSLLTAAVFRPIIMANAEFRFLWALQLQITKKMETKSESWCSQLVFRFLFCVHSLSCDLDELLQQLHSLIKRHTHEHLGHDPLLDLVTALEEDRERRRVAGARSATQSVVHQLLLHDTWKHFWK